MNKYVDLLEPVSIDIGTNSAIVISVTKLDDREPYLDLRVHARSVTYSGPTKKGFSMPLEMIETLIVTLNRVNEDCESIGL